MANEKKKVEFEDRERTITDLNKQIEVLRMQLAGCGAVAMSNTKDSAERNRISKDNPYYSASMLEVEKAVDREMKYRNEIKELKAERVCPKEKCESWRDELEEESRTYVSWCDNEKGCKRGFQDQFKEACK